MPQFQAQFGDYTDMFIQLFHEVDPAFEFIIYDLRKGDIPRDLDECEAYITTGSRVSTYDKDVAWIPPFIDLIRKLHKAKKKLVGICFGHQLIADALGGKTVNSDKGWGVGVSINQIDHTQPWMKPPLSSINIIVSHQDQVTELPNNAVLVAKSEFCPNYMIQIDEHILTIQGHPEFSKQYSETLMTHRKDLLGENTYRKGIASLSLKTDEKTVMQWIVNFMQR